jgi:hypothetical protein
MGITPGTVPSSADVRRLVKWIAILAFFLISPAVVIVAVSFLIENVSPIRNNVISDFSEDSATILLAFYFGGVGGIIRHIFHKLYYRRSSESTFEQMAKLLLSGLVGSAAYFVLRSAILVRILYPSLDVSSLSKDDIAYYNIVFVSVLAGMVAPSLVRYVEKRASAAANKPADRA